MEDLRTQSLREYIEHLRESGYSVANGHTPDPDLIDPEGNPVYTWQEGYPYDERMDRDEYEREKYRLQVELFDHQFDRHARQRDALRRAGDDGDLVFQSVHEGSPLCVWRPVAGRHGRTRRV